MNHPGQSSTLLLTCTPGVSICIYFTRNHSLSWVSVRPSLVACFNVIRAIRRDAHRSAPSRGSMRFSVKHMHACICTRVCCSMNVGHIKINMGMQMSFMNKDVLKGIFRFKRTNRNLCILSLKTLCLFCASLASQQSPYPLKPAAGQFTIFQHYRLAVNTSLFLLLEEQTHLPLFIRFWCTQIQILMPVSACGANAD